MSEAVEEVDPLEQKLAEVVAQVEESRLPGWANYLERDQEARKWTDEQYDRMLSAIRDDDEVLFERAAASWRKAFCRINERLAESYRQANANPELWDLRFFKWMKHVIYIKFESELGTFYLVPQKPRKKPRAEYWYTADEMIGMLQPATAAAINTFKQLPVRPESLKGPEKGEKHMRVDLTGSAMGVKFDLGGHGNG
jgi:hypothetical protein